MTITLNNWFEAKEVLTTLANDKGHIGWYSATGLVDGKIVSGPAIYYKWPVGAIRVLETSAIYELSAKGLVERLSVGTPAQLEHGDYSITEAGRQYITENYKRPEDYDKEPTLYNSGAGLLQILYWRSTYYKAPVYSQFYQEQPDKYDKVVLRYDRKIVMGVPPTITEQDKAIRWFNFGVDNLIAQMYDLFKYGLLQVKKQDNGSDIYSLTDEAIIMVTDKINAGGHANA